MSKSLTSANEKRKAAASSSVTQPKGFRLKTVRLITLASDLRPDKAFWEDQFVDPEVYIHATEATRHSNWTSFVFGGRAVLPSTEKKTKTPAWKLKASFFIVVGHPDAATNLQVQKFVATTVVPLVAMRFQNILEVSALWGGVIVHPAASAGVAIDDLEISVVEEVSNESS